MEVILLSRYIDIKINKSTKFYLLYSFLIVFLYL